MTEPNDDDKRIAKAVFDELCMTSQIIAATGVEPTDENVDAWQVERLSQVSAAAREQGRAEANAPIPPGHIKDDRGVVRRVLGTLPVTRDGVVVIAEDAYFIDRHAHKNYDGTYSAEIKLAHRDHTGEGRWFNSRDGSEVCRISECYSTRGEAEAALAARGNT